MQFQVKSAQLRDGRTLGYAEYGQLGGKAVVYYHGAPGSSFIHTDMAATAARLGIWLIAIDRPGYGASSPNPQSSLASFADDVIELCDQLGVAQFSILGFSGGTPYSLACAARHPARVHKVALVGTLAPLSAPGISESLSEMVRGLYDLARHNPDQLRATFATLAPSPAALVAVMCATASPWDQEVLQARKEGFEQEYARGLQQGVAGMTADFEINANDWGFDLKAVAAQVDVRCGTADQNTPLAMARYISSQLNHSTLHVLQDEGHFTLYPHWEEILSNLT